MNIFLWKRNVDFTLGSVNAGDCAFDSWSFTNPTGYSPPTICGINDGQHMYIDAGFNDAGDITITGMFTGSTFDRMWKVKVSQIECGALWAPEPGCVNYVTGVSGQVRSFNFNQNVPNEV